MKPKQSIITAALLLLASAASGAESEETVTYLSDAYDDLSVALQQGWGNLGRDTAAVPTDGRAGSPLKLGEKTFEKGLGHHAPGHLTFQLPEGRFMAFAALVGVHFQGGGRGSVVFQVFVDGEKAFDSGKLTDSDPPVEVQVPLAGARELQLVSTDAGDGYGCDMANWVDARLISDPNGMWFGAPSVKLNGKPAPAPSSAVCDFALIAEDAGPQVASLGRRSFAACMRGDESVEVEVPAANVGVGVSLEAEVALLDGGPAEVSLALGEARTSSLTLRQGTALLRIAPDTPARELVVRLRTSGVSGESLVRWRNVRFVTGGDARSVTLMPSPPREETYPPPLMPALRGGMERALVEWDWRMQDGIGTPREPVTYAVAVERILKRGAKLIWDLREDGVKLDEAEAQWRTLQDRFAALVDAEVAGDHPLWEELWLRVHKARREIVFANPLAHGGPLLFSKRVPAAFSHQLTQYYGHCARPGGGLFVLDAPGESMACRLLTSELPGGNFMQPEVSYDASRILFAYCPLLTPPPPRPRRQRPGCYFRLYEIRPDGTGLRQLTDGPFDDFSPRELPNGQLMFLSTRAAVFTAADAGLVPCTRCTWRMATARTSAPCPSTRPRSGIPPSSPTAA